jgi:hypothetical protein
MHGPVLSLAPVERQIFSRSFSTVGQVFDAKQRNLAQSQASGLPPFSLYALRSANQGKSVQFSLLQL